MSEICIQLLICSSCKRRQRIFGLSLVRCADFRIIDDASTNRVVIWLQTSTVELCQIILSFPYYIELILILSLLFIHFSLHICNVHAGWFNLRLFRIQLKLLASSHSSQLFNHWAHLMQLLANIIFRFIKFLVHLNKGIVSLVSELCGHVLIL